jgi:DNA-binding GntR family transcriptional regulator
MSRSFRAQAGPAKAKRMPERASGSARGGPSSLAEAAYTRIEELIVMVRLEPGSYISEEALSEHIGIGRTPVREALQRLAHERLIAILPRHGMYVSEINAQSQLKLLELRREVERLMARCAARRASDAERREFEGYAAEFRRIAAEQDAHAYLRVDSTFYPALARSARNEYATAPLAMWHSHSRRFWYYHHSRGTAADIATAVTLKAAVAAAVARGDETAAARAVDDLLDFIERYTRAALELH